MGHKNEGNRDNMIATLVPLIIWLVPFFLLLGVLNFWRTYLDKQNKRSPLSQNLLRSPGESLRKKIEDINWDLAAIRTLEY